MKSRKQVILDTISDLVSNLLYYDRKEDEALGVLGIDEAVRAGEISVDEMAAAFRSELSKGLL